MTSCILTHDNDDSEGGFFFLILSLFYDVIWLFLKKKEESKLKNTEEKNPAWGLGRLVPKFVETEERKKKNRGKQKYINYLRSALQVA